MSKPFVQPMAVTPPTAKEEQDTEDLKQACSLLRCSGQVSTFVYLNMTQQGPNSLCPGTYTLHRHQ